MADTPIILFIVEGEKRDYRFIEDWYLNMQKQAISFKSLIRFININVNI